MPNAIHESLRTVRSLLVAVRQWPQAADETNMLRMALGEVRDDMTEANRAIDQLRKDVHGLYEIKSSRAALYASWAAAAEEGRNRRSK